MTGMAVAAVIFDWGGTLTPWHSIDHAALWHDICAAHFPQAQTAAVAAAILAAENVFWEQCDTEQRSATLDHVFAQAGVTAHAALLDSYFRAWEPHTYTDPEVVPLLRELRRRGIRTGVLSNTMWPREQHERVFHRDDVLGLIDGAVYSSEIPWTKPHPEAFRAAMAAIGVSDPASCVFVGDRPFDDIFGAKSLGMRAVLRPNPAVPGYDGARPDAVIGRLSELLPHLDNW
jgi:putative hydrolase of the HAD superfamily